MIAHKIFVVKFLCLKYSACMKILVISDIHGSVSAFDKVLSVFKNENCSHMIICGDYLNHGPRNDIPSGYNTKELAARLNEYKSVITAVRGNCDSEVDQMMLEFPMMAPHTEILLPCSGRIVRFFVHHGHLYETGKILEWTKPGTVIISGHTHIPVLNELKSLQGQNGPDGAGQKMENVPSLQDNEWKTFSSDSYVFLNPGSVSIPKAGSKAGYAVINLDENTAFPLVKLAEL